MYAGTCLWANDFIAINYEIQIEKENYWVYIDVYKT